MDHPPPIRKADGRGQHLGPEQHRDPALSRPNPMLTEPMTPVLLRMTGPMILGIIAILAFNLVDTFFIGMLGTQALAAISFTFPVTFVVTSLTMGLGAGLCALLGHALGQGRHDEAARITTDCLFLAVILVTLLAVLGALTIEPLFTLLGASAELISLIHDYMLIWYLTVPMLVIPMVGNAAIRTTGDTKTPSLVMGVAGLVNGVLDPLLIFGPGPFPEWGIRGAAIATSISWLMAMLVSLHILRKREQLLSWRLSPAAAGPLARPAAGGGARLLHQHAQSAGQRRADGHLRRPGYRGGGRLWRRLQGGGAAADRHDGALFRAGPLRLAELRGGQSGEGQGRPAALHAVRPAVPARHLRPRPGCLLQGSPICSAIIRRWSASSRFTCIWCRSVMAFRAW